MKLKLWLLLFILFPLLGQTQNTYFNHNSDDNIFLDRLEIKTGSLENVMHLDAGITDRYIVKKFLEETDTSKIKTTKADLFWLQYLVAENRNAESDSGDSKKKLPWGIYNSKANFYEVNTSGIYLALNPVLAVETGKGFGNKSIYTRNTRGYELRGSLGNKLGFYSYLTDNQVWMPNYVNEYVGAHKVLPGEGFLKPYKTTGYDFFDARGYITFAPIKNIQIKFGNDRNFIGSGYRSLLLSDFAQDYLNLRINTQVWRFSYSNIFAELADRNVRLSGIYAKKYAAFHYLSYDVSKWLNVGFFEGIIFYDGKTPGRGFELNYLNPIIFYRTAEQNLGSGDNALMGINWNAIAAKHFRLYGQVILDDIKLGQVIPKNTGWWGNKYGLQAGFKYIDVLGLPNVDWQSEANMVMPYTYSHDTTAKNYAHFNQALAHPLGANFMEVINILRINPYAPLVITLKHFYMLQGRDTNGVNLGADIYRNYYTHPNDYGNKILQGEKSTTQLLEATASYQIKHNLFVDLKGIYRREKSATKTLNTNYIGFGIRLNFVAHNYNF
ncbi:MAG: hypothetical protein NTX03_15570 [Bacteroidetes bacterium]|nr:hypothetical protein [Bacteroidota bacterium]